MRKQAPNVTVIDYGIGNLLSITRGLEKCGANVVVTNSPDLIANADRLLLPGVGSFSKGMSELHKRNLVDPIKIFSEKKRPFMGICLGMQMMLSTSEEFGKHKGLNLIPGNVVSIPKTKKDGSTHKIPHIGWNELHCSDSTENCKNAILKGIKQKKLVYFVHSFMVNPDQKKHIVASCDYNGRKLTSIICSDNLYGCQFHPEKSGLVGLKILENFCSI
jgi:imidazole glycerol-phosphate synthase subunit HisH